MGMLSGIHLAKGILDKCYLTRFVERIEQIETLFFQLDKVRTENYIVLQYGLTSAHLMASFPEWIINRGMGVLL